MGTNVPASIEMLASNGHFSIIYATPEKLLSWESGLKRLVNSSKIICLAVDESHCVSDWGHDFRPQYRNVVDIRRVIGYHVPVVALTASATAAVQADILNNLQLRNPMIVKLPLNRPNLKYFVVQKHGPNDVATILWRFRKEQLEALKLTKEDGSKIPFHATLIYVNSKREANEISELLSKCKSIDGIGVATYHADMSADDRAIAHAMFLADRVQVMVATTAYGMGKHLISIALNVHILYYKNDNSNSDVDNCGNIK